MMSTMKFVSATTIAIMMTMPWTATKSRALMYSDSMKPMPFHSKEVSVSTAPDSSSAICSPMHRDDRDERRPVRVLGQQPVLADAARARRGDVLRAERADHVRAHEAQEDAGGQDAEREAGQDRVPEHVADGSGIAQPDRVDQVEPARGLDGLQQQLGARRCAPCDREPVEPHREDELQQDRDEEDRGRVHEDRADAEHRVGPAVAAVRRDQTERDADHERDDERVERQLERGRPVREQDLRDGAVVGDRRAEVTPQDAADVLEVLHDERPVVARCVDALLQLVGSEAAAERRRDRVAREPHEEEDDRHDDEDRRDDEEEPDEDVAPHPAAFGRYERAC